MEAWARVPRRPARSGDGPGRGVALGGAGASARTPPRRKVAVGTPGLKDLSRNVAAGVWLGAGQGSHPAGEPRDGGPVHLRVMAAVHRQTLKKHLLGGGQVRVPAPPVRLGSVHGWSVRGGSERGPSCWSSSAASELICVLVPGGDAGSEEVDRRRCGRSIAGAAVGLVAAQGICDEAESVLDLLVGELCGLVFQALITRSRTRSGSGQC